MKLLRPTPNPKNGEFIFVARLGLKMRCFNDFIFRRMPIAMGRSSTVSLSDGSSPRVVVRRHGMQC